jgi:hypothetical protein
MYSLTKSMTLRKLVVGELPSFGIAFIVAEFFYKFHSFAIECGAFLATWFVLSYIFSKAGSIIHQPETDSQT